MYTCVTCGNDVSQSTSEVTYGLILSTVGNNIHICLDCFQALHLFRGTIRAEYKQAKYVKLYFDELETIYPYICVTIKLLTCSGVFECGIIKRLDLVLTSPETSALDICGKILKRVDGFVSIRP